ncbi:MAG: hypothetical protein ACREPN_07060 [Rudaea sp.]
MNQLTSFLGAVAMALTGLVAIDSFAATPQIDLERAQQSRAQLQALATQALAGKESGVAGAKPGGAHAAELFANPDRAYPPSCLNSPMPLGMWQNDPNALHANITLIGDPYAGNQLEQQFIETDTVYLFRVVCSSGKSATLLEIDRPSGHDATLYPTLPAVSVAQGSNNIYIRVIDDPNTFFATTYPLNPLINSDVFVLENFYGDSVQFDYNQPFVLTVDNLRSNDPNRYTQYPMPIYNPAQYAQAALPLPISGYMTGAWFDPAHSGEGFQIEVGEQGTPGSANDRYIVVAWYTYDTSGASFWLYGAGSFTSGDTTASIPMQFTSGGGFGGNFGSTANFYDWGTVNVQFPDCNTLKFSYLPLPSLPTGVPSSSGTKTWTRLTQMNGLTCQ